MRHLRWPLPTGEFNALALPVCEFRLNTAWWNLRWASRLELVFHASATGRLTPDSGNVRCIYLAEREATSFYELYGDDLAAAKQGRSTIVLPASELQNRRFATAQPDATLRLYDLTTEGSARKIGMDLATLYTETIEHPRQFAQRLHDHPARFDGILYLSRHTQGSCLVLWPTHSPHLRSMKLTARTCLWDHARFVPSLPPGQVELFDAVLGVASA